MESIGGVMLHVSMTDACIAQLAGLVRVSNEKIDAALRTENKSVLWWR